MGAVAGIDWAAEEHASAIADEHGRRSTTQLVATRARDRRADRRCWSSHAVERVAIERPDGLLVDAPAGRGHAVLAIHPNQVKAARDRFRPAGGKSDAFDAFVLGRAGPHRRPPLAGARARRRRDRGAARADPRSREDLVATRVELANRCAPSSTRFWPGAAAIFADVDSPDRARLPRALPQPRRRPRPGPQAPGRLSSPATATAAAAAPPSCSNACAGAPVGRAGEPSAKPAARSCSAWSPPLRPTRRRRSRLLTSQITRRARRAPRRRDLPQRSSATPSRRHRRRACWPRSATAATATRPPTPWPPTPA